MLPHLKFSPLNLFGFSLVETEIDTIVGITYTSAIIGSSTWVVGTTMFEPKSISLQSCRKCLNFIFSKPFLRKIENNV